MNFWKTKRVFTALIALFGLLFFLPQNAVFADGNVGPPKGINLPNPLGLTETIPQLLEKIIRFLGEIASPIVAIIVIYGAFQILFAAGNPEKFATGKKTILYAVIGYAIIWIGWGIAKAIADFIGGAPPPS